MPKEDHKTHYWILLVHIIVSLAILVTYVDIKNEIRELKEVNLIEVQNQILQSL
jgi:hypothetical protein